MNNEPLMIEIPVVVRNGKVEFLYGALPPLKEKTIGSLTPEKINLVEGAAS